MHLVKMCGRNPTLQNRRGEGPRKLAAAARRRRQPPGGRRKGGTSCTRAASGGIRIPDKKATASARSGAGAACRSGGERGGTDDRGRGYPFGPARAGWARRERGGPGQGGGGKPVVGYNYCAKRVLRIVGCRRRPEPGAPACPAAGSRPPAALTFRLPGRGPRPQLFAKRAFCEQLCRRARPAGGWAGLLHPEARRPHSQGERSSGGTCSRWSLAMIAWTYLQEGRGAAAASSSAYR